MEFTSEDDPPHIRLGKTLRNYTMIGYYSILRKLNNIEEDGEILTRAGTFDKYWEEKEKITNRNNNLCSKVQVYYRDLGKYIHTIEKVLKNNSAQTRLKKEKYFLRK